MKVSHITTYVDYMKCLCDVIRDNGQFFILFQPCVNKEVYA